LSPIDRSSGRECLVEEDTQSASRLTKGGQEEEGERAEIQGGTIIALT
jgi:hypothetical protein